MHGIKRSREPPTSDSVELARVKFDKDTRRLDAYRTVLDLVLSRSAAQDYSPEALESTSTVLALNPEFCTGWSYRRRILLHGIFPTSDPTSIQALLATDLQLTNRSLKANPKNYSVWEHRKWVLEHMPDANWRDEMSLVDAYLERDGRNFHSWDYRRYLVAAIRALPSAQVDPSSTATPSPSTPALPPLVVPTTESEIHYTTRKISSNFSNFSAWHYRTKLLIKYFEENAWSLDSPERRERIDLELDLVKQAFWSDPNDQSAWLYHRWLVGDAHGSVTFVSEEIGGIEELLAEEPDSRWCLDSLVYYKRLLRSILVPTAATDPAVTVKIDELDRECAEMLRKLELVDPMRRRRYQDLAAAVVP